MKTLVIGLGGNALLDPSGKQSFATENRSIYHITKSIALVSKSTKFRILITHGNGSQVGDELMRNEHAEGSVPKLPFYLINAETQASIGTVIETSMRNSLNSLGISKEVCVVLSHVLVDKNDPAFEKPSKQIGPMYTIEELKDELKLDRFNYLKIGSKYRRVIASPKPVGILELKTIKYARGDIVIACGGGGIPVIVDGKGIAGVSAVIDKDFSTQLLANSVGAETMVILTNAGCIYRDYKRKKGQIKNIAAKDLKKMLPDLEEGTIRPKAEACVRFIENGGREAYIGNALRLGRILNHTSGTRII